MEIISRSKKEILWHGLPSGHGNALERTRAEKLGLSAQIDKQQNYLQVTQHLPSTCLCFLHASHILASATAHSTAFCAFCAASVFLSSAIAACQVWHLPSLILLQSIYCVRPMLSRNTASWDDTQMAVHAYLTGNDVQKEAADAALLWICAGTAENSNSATKLDKAQQGFAS